MKKKYFGNGKGIFFSYGMYNTPIEQKDNLLYDFMLEDGFKVNNLRQLGFPSMGQDNYLSDYAVKYNCIGWAFGIDADIEPVLPQEDYITYNTFGDFLNLTHDVYPLSEKLDKYVKSTSILYPYNYKNATIHTKDNMFNYYPKEGDVAFYFGKNTETKILAGDQNILLHAARYFNVDTNEYKWTSKIGEGLCVSHDLVDLIGDAYGTPEFILCDL